MAVHSQSALDQFTLLRERESPFVEMEDPTVHLKGLTGAKTRSGHVTIAGVDDDGRGKCSILCQYNTWHMAETILCPQASLLPCFLLQQASGLFQFNKFLKAKPHISIHGARFLIKFLYKLLRGNWGFYPLM